MDRLRIGIIGCGNISGAYLRLAPLYAGMEVRAVADIKTDAANDRGREFGIQVLSIEDLLASDEIDIVVNLTVPDAHYSVSKEILGAGKHVYTEKPLTLTLEEGLSLQKLAAERNCRIGSAPDTFLGGAHQQARALIDEGLIGEIVAGTSHVMSHGMEHWHPNPDFFFLPGGGPVLDVGPYHITNLIQLIGPIRRVAALASAAFQTRTIRTDGPRMGEAIPVRTPTNVHALLEFDSGATVTLSASWDVWAHGHSNMELYGTAGTLFVPDPNFFGGSLDHAGQDSRVKSIAGWDHPFGRPNEAHAKLGPLSNYRAAGLADMARAIFEDRPHRCSLELALHAVDAMTSILRSAEEQAWQSLSTSCPRPDPLGPEAARELLAEPDLDPLQHGVVH